MQGLLFLGGDLVAKNKETLQANGITHVINCAGDYSSNYFSESITYKTYHLKDSNREV